MTEVGSPPEAEVNLSTRRQIGYFDRAVRRRLADFKGREGIQVRRVESDGLDYYYQADLSIADHSYFTVQRRGEDFSVEFGREGDKLIKRVIFEHSSDEVKAVLSVRSVTYDEAQALLVVMRRPKAFTVKNPPDIINLSPQEAGSVATSTQDVFS